MNKIYVDLDGVMANFEKGIVEATGAHYWDRTCKKFWSVIDKEPGFFTNLELLPSSLAMFNLIMDKHGEEVVEILTATPEPTGHLADAAKDKAGWVRTLVHPTVQFNSIVGGKNKYKFLEDNPGTLLIDDYARNINLWIEHGGVGILHTDPASTIAKLEVLGLL